MRLVMTTFRLIPLPIAGALQMLTGMVTLAAPFALGLSPAAMVIAVALGAMLVGLSLAAVVDERGLTALPVSTLHALDYGLAIGMFGAAAVVGLAGDARAAVTFGAIAAVQLLLNLTTRYSLRG